MIEGILVCIAIYIAYRWGWISAHHMVSLECQRNGGFFVGKKSFKCMEVKGGESHQEAETP